MSVHQPITAARPRFTLTAEAYQRLSAMPPADRALNLQIMAHEQHYRAFNPLGKWRALDGIPQMKAWEREGPDLIAEAHDVFDNWDGEELELACSHRRVCP